MNRTEFLQGCAVGGFTDWLAGKADTLMVDLDIKRSRFVPRGIRQRLLGMNAVLPHYVWRSEGTGEGRWPETQQHLGQLGGALKRALEAGGDDDVVMDVCRQILLWGRRPQSEGRGVDVPGAAARRQGPGCVPE